MKMRILHPDRIVNRHVGGNTTYTRRIREGLARRGVQLGTIPALPHPVLTAAAENAYSLRRMRHSVLHFSADTGPMIRTRTGSVVTVHGVASRWTAVARTPAQEQIWRSRVGAAIRNTDRLITVSESSSADITEVFGVRSEQIRTIPHGIDAEVFASPVELSPELARFEGRPFALFVGNLEPRKNIVELIRAFGRPEIRTTGLDLLIIGRPAWNYDEILREIEASPWVTRLGFVTENDKIAMMQRCTVFLFPSHYEGFGFPVLEALAAGAPVICSDRGSLAEVAGPSLRLAALDSESMAAQIAAYLEDTNALRACRSAGPEWARSFSWEKSVDQHIAVYQEILND
ncbi:glycosyltransferase family 1 protein [Actinoplanes sp. NPDC049802]|uniref:glycosyltransferase family 4 protein n=1 Tax=Actinoplanes sp. NPDC049802 TaxID=3154742 RepID=UPI00340E9097